MTASWTRRNAWAVILGFGLVLPASAQGPDPLGSEFQVNTYTTGDQGSPAVSKSADSFVVVWQDRNEFDGDQQGIRGQRYASDGTALSGEFQVNSFTTGDQEDPAVAMAPNGDFVVVWSGEGATDSNGVHARRFASDGMPSGAELLVNSTTSSSQTRPDVAIDANGDFVVVWRSLDSVYGQLFDSAGGMVGGEFQINDSNLNDNRPAVAMNASGAFVVAWERLTVEGPGYFAIQARRYASDGSEVGDDFQVSDSSEYQYAPDVGIDDEGDFVVAWEDYVGDVRGVAAEIGDNIRAQRLDSSGAEVGAEFQVNTYSTGYQFAPSIGVRPDGFFVISWSSNEEPPIAAKRYASDGTVLGSEFQVNTYTTGGVYAPVLTVDAEDEFIVTWRAGSIDTDGPDSDEGAARAQIFGLCTGADPMDDADGDGTFDACDACVGDDTTGDGDDDGFCDDTDICEGFDDADDSDADGVPNGCDACEGFDDAEDADGDDVPDGCDVCEGDDASGDSDMDDVCNDTDICEGFDDAADADDDDVPDGCDACEGFDDSADADADNVPDGCDVCEGFDDSADADRDTVPDGCDVCEGFDDLADADADTVPDGCDICAGFPDSVDTDMDGVPNGCDVCEGFPDFEDEDGDMIPDGCDDEVPPAVILVSSTPDTEDDVLTFCEEVSTELSQLELTFSESMNPQLAGLATSYLVIAPGDDASLDTTDCTAVDPGDEVIPIDGIAFANPVVTLDVALDEEQQYRLLACESLIDAAGNALDGDPLTAGTEAFVHDFRINTSNLFSNGQFDCDLESWTEAEEETRTPPEGIFWDPEDVDDSSSSGSALIGAPDSEGLELTQCVAVDADEGLVEAAEHRFASALQGFGAETGQAVVSRSCEFFAAEGCAGAATGSYVAPDQFLVASDGSWLELETSFEIPAGTVSAACRFRVANAEGSTLSVALDALILSPSIGAIFADGFESGNTSAWAETTP